MNTTATFGTAPIGSRTDASAAMPLRQRLLQHLAAAIGWLIWQMEKRRSRLALLELSDDQLKDIGLSRSQAHGIATRRPLD